MVKNNPIFYAALICAFIFYSGIIKPSERSSFTTLLSAAKINNLTGEIVSSPVKIQNGNSAGKYYSVKVKAKAVSTSDRRNFSAKGILTVFLPVEMVEALYPGRLYSSSQKTGSFLCESGNNIVLNGKMIEKNGNPVFITSYGYDSGWEKNLTGRIFYIRALCRLQLKRMLYAWGEAGGLLLALLTGAKEYTNANISTSFKNAGLSHILALSGMHLSIFSGISIIFGKKLKNYLFVMISRPVSIILFVWFAGFSPSLLRAFICSLVVIIETFLNIKKSDMLIILSFSFLFQTILSPADVYNTGFILSYGALAGILIAGKFFNQMYTKILPTKIASDLSASTGAQLFAAPVSLKLFGSFCPFGIIASLIVSPLITIFIYSGLFLILLNSLFPIFLDISGIFINFLYTVIITIVNVFSHLPIVNIGE